MRRSQDEIRTIYSRPSRERRSVNGAQAQFIRNAPELGLSASRGADTGKGASREHAMALRHASAQAARRRAGTALNASAPPADAG